MKPFFLLFSVLLIPASSQAEGALHLEVAEKSKLIMEMDWKYSSSETIQNIVGTEETSNAESSELRVAVNLDVTCHKVKKGQMDFKIKAALAEGVFSGSGDEAIVADAKAFKVSFSIDQHGVIKKLSGFGGFKKALGGLGRKLKGRDGQAFKKAMKHLNDKTFKTMWQLMFPPDAKASKAPALVVPFAKDGLKHIVSFEEDESDGKQRFKALLEHHVEGKGGTEEQLSCHSESLFHQAWLYESQGEVSHTVTVETGRKGEGEATNYFQKANSDTWSWRVVSLE